MRMLSAIRRVAPGVLTVCLALTAARPARASLTVLVGEPFGNFGTMMPVGHTAVYLDHLCADGALKLRACRPDEPEGVVIARYHQIGHTDWMVSPVMEFLYAVERPEEALTYATPETVWALRQQYRRRYLADLVPDGQEKAKATNEWWESAGVAYNRRVWGYELRTTAAQDAAFMATMNADLNQHRYHLKRTNCASFAADMVNLYYPGLVRGGDHVADFGLMTPKQVARSVWEYGQSHPEAGLRVIEVPQVPGTLRRSRPVRGSAEAALKTKRYLFTLLAIQPEVPPGLLILYLAHGRWPVAREAEVAGPEFFASGRQDAAVAASGGGR